ncbi:MAG: cation:proton antiporter [Oligoflexia bacterium]|nr:cation:proton antiporter [Oligoflexia bacterium]MBF0367158.1 cation:proton antiporter [Oligoflexia bacterium]
MHDLSYLIQDLGIILITAAVIAILFKKLKQPVVLGYLVAGFLLSPQFTFYPTVHDLQDISIWAEIGVIFMLFGLGLEFSFKKLAKEGKGASITAVFEIFSMLGIGYLTGQFLGWSKMDALFLGGILSISSTTIIVRAVEELGLKGKNFVSLVFGVLIIEDLIAILLLVLLSSIAATQALSGSDLLFSSLRLIFFLLLWFLLGIYLIPTLLRKVRNFLTDETTLIISIGLCLMMVIIANNVGFSPALGAFVMGSILAETREGHRIEQLILPVKNLFSAIFFVSIGMLINPFVLSEHLGSILLISALTITGKFLSTTIGALVSGQGLKNSVQAGMGLAQIGEFSFIIATLGLNLKVTSDFLYPIAVAVSAITTLTTPYLLQHSNALSFWLDQKFPSELKEWLHRYEAALHARSEESTLTLLWKAYGIKMILNSVLVVAITWVLQRFIIPEIKTTLSLDNKKLVDAIACLMALTISAPFLGAVVLGGPRNIAQYKQQSIEQLQRLQFGTSLVRFLIGLTLVGFVVSNFTSILAYSGVLLVILASIAIFFFGPYSRIIYRKIEDHFLINLSENERAKLKIKATSLEVAPWNEQLLQSTLSPDSILISKQLPLFDLKENFGLTSALMGDTSNHLLSSQEQLIFIGTEEQFIAANEVLALKSPLEAPPEKNSLELITLLLLPSDDFINQSINESKLCERIKGLVIALERNNQRIMNPDSSLHLLSGDLLWIIGDPLLIKALRVVKF